MGRFEAFPLPSDEESDNEPLAEDVARGANHDESLPLGLEGSSEPAIDKVTDVEPVQSEGVIEHATVNGPEGNSTESMVNDHETELTEAGGQVLDSGPVTVAETLEVAHDSIERAPNSPIAVGAAYVNRFKTNFAEPFAYFAEGQYATGARKYIGMGVKNTLIIFGGGLDVAGRALHKLGDKVGDIDTAGTKAIGEQSLKSIFMKYANAEGEDKRMTFGTTMRQMAGLQAELYGYALHRLGKGIAR